MATTTTAPRKPKLGILAAAAGFTTLSEAERRLLEAAPDGRIVFCGPNGKQLTDPEYDAAKADAWGDERSVRAALLRWLCVDEDARKLVDPAGIRLRGARIVQRLTLSYVKVSFPLSLIACWLPDGLALDGGELPAMWLEQSWLGPLSPPQPPASGTSFVANSARINGLLSLNRTHIEGMLGLYNAHVGGNLECSGASLNNAGKVAIQAEKARITGAVYLRNGFVAEGEIRFPGAQIGDSLECDGAALKNPGQVALQAARARIDGAVLIRERFSAEGEIRFLGAQIGSNLECDGASLKNPGKVALQAERARIGGAVLLRGGFTAEGEVRFFATEIGGNFQLSDARLDSARITFNACQMQVKDALNIRRVSYGLDTIVDLRVAYCGTLDDDPTNWPWPGNLRLDGFVYDRLSDPGTASERLEWLRRELPADEARRANTFRPQPYRQLAQALRAAGHESEARHILIGMAEDRREYARLSTWSRNAARLLWYTTRNGYQPLRAVFGLMILWALNVGLFALGSAHGLMAPTDQKAYEAFAGSGTGTPACSNSAPNCACSNSVPNWYPDFNPVAYAIDVSLPLISLGERDKWQLVRKSVNRTCVHWRWFSGFLGFWRGLATLGGWFFATMLLAGVTGLVVRE